MKNNSKVYKTLNNKISNMIVREALKGSYLAYVHLYAHQHLFDEFAFFRLSLVVNVAYPFEIAVASGKLNVTIQSFFTNYKCNSNGKTI